MLLGHIALNLAHGQNVPPARSLHRVCRLQWVGHAICLEFDGLWRVNVLYVDLVVSNICYHVLFQLLRLSLFDVAEVHVVAALDQLLLSVCVGPGSVDVGHVQFVVVEELFGLASLGYLGLQQA